MTDKKRKEDEEKKDKERNELQKAWDDLLNLHKLVSRWLLFVFLLAITGLIGLSGVFIFVIASIVTLLGF